MPQIQEGASEPVEYEPDPDFDGWDDEAVASEAEKVAKEHQRRKALAGAAVAAEQAAATYRAAAGIRDGMEWKPPTGYLDAVPPGGTRVFEGDLYENTSGEPLVHSPAEAPEAWTLIEENVDPTEPDPDDHPEWETGVAYEVGDVVAYQGALWECTFAHTSQVTWEPSPGYMWNRVE